MKDVEKKVPEKMEEQQEKRPVFVPAVDIYEHKDSILMYCDLPGVAQDKLEITLENQELTIRGEQAAPAVEGLDCMIGEYQTGIFQRSFKVPQAIDDAKIRARLTQGVLELTLPKAEEALPKKIAVHAG